MRGALGVGRPWRRARRTAPRSARGPGLVLVTVAISSLIGAAPVVSAPAAATPGPPTIEAWIYPGTTGEPTCSTAQELTALASSPVALLKAEYLTVSARGAVQTETSTSLPCNGFSASNVAAVRAAASHVYVTVSAGRGARSLLANARRTAAATTAISAFVDSSGLDGVDLDFEPGRWSKGTWRHYVAFVSGLVHVLGPARGVEVDLGAFSSTPWDAERYGDVAGAGAHLVVMAYDHEYDVACAAISPYAWLSGVVAYAKSQVPSASLTIGIPAYGYTTTTCTKVAHVTSNVAYVTMEGFPGFPSGPAATAAARDPGSGELRWQSGPTLYDVVDATALNAKLQLVELAGVRDVSVWSLGGEPWFTGDPG